MTFQDAFNEVKNIFIHSDMHECCSHLSMQITMTGEGGGTFYVLFRNGNLIVEPYDYKDHDILFVADTQDFLKMARGEMNVIAGYTAGKLQIYGDVSRASEIQHLFGVHNA